jgi:hypothetical protein
VEGCFAVNFKQMDGSTMRELKPYQTLAGAKAALDNGGRIYNLVALAADNRISKGELNKAAGVFSGEQKAFLFLYMAIAKLPDNQQAEVLSMLDRPLAKRYKSHGPQQIDPAAMNKARVGQLIVVDGYPRLHERKTHRAVVPMMVGKVMVMVPVETHYDGYQLFTTASGTGTPGWVCVKRPKVHLTKIPTRFGGSIRQYTDKKQKTTGLFLEAIYFYRLDS